MPNYTSEKDWVIIPGNDDVAVMAALLQYLGLTVKKHPFLEGDILDTNDNSNKRLVFEKRERE